MYDPIRHQYQLNCPTRGTATWVAVSDFRLVKRLRGAANPAVFRVRHACACGDEHEALVTHDELDLEPLGTSSTGTFVDLLTGTTRLVADELEDQAQGQLRRGRWPWTFFCWPEHRARPGYPSSVRLVADGAHRAKDRLGVVVRCHHCARLSLNFVTRPHLDVPFYNDDVIAFVDRPLHGEHLSDEERFRHELDNGGGLGARAVRLDERRAS